MSVRDHRSILIVEDSDEDFEVTLWACRKSAFEIPIIRCKDGDEAIEHLEQRSYHTGLEAKLPALVLLDLNLPKTDGRQVLQHIKTSERLRFLPVVVMTTSNNPRDVEACYLHGANSYVLKPMGLFKLQALIQGLVEYWFQLVRLPRGESNDNT